MRILLHALTHYGLVTPYGNIDLSNTSAKLLPKSMLTYMLSTVTVTWEQFH